MQLTLAQKEQISASSRSSCTLKSSQCTALAKKSLRGPGNSLLTALEDVAEAFPLTLLKDGAPSTRVHCLLGSNEVQLRKVSFCLAHQSQASPVAVQDSSSMHESSYRPVFTASHRLKQKLTAKKNISNKSSSASQGTTADKEHRHRRT